MCFHSLTFHNLLKRTGIVLWGNTNVTNKLIVYSPTGGIYTKLLNIIFMYSWFSDDIAKIINNYRSSEFFHFKVARYSFSGPTPPKFEHKLCCHKQSFGKIATTVVLDEDGNLL